MKNTNLFLNQIIDRFIVTYDIFLNDFQSLIRTIISLQNRDTVTDRVCYKLFKFVKIPEDILSMTKTELQFLLSSVNFYKTKTKTIVTLAKCMYYQIIDIYTNDLLLIKGIGKKVYDCFNMRYNNNIVVDTHVFRIIQRLQNKKLSYQQTQDFIMKHTKKQHFKFISQNLIHFGRKVCSIKPRCGICKLKKYCLFTNKQF